MGFIKVFAGAIGGAFADQWKDYLSIPPLLPATVGLCAAVRNRTNMNRDSNIKGNENIITNGSLVLIPEGFALMTIENGAITGFISDPGGYKWTSTNLNSKSFFNQDGFIDTLIEQSWERFKFGGIPSASQMAFYVNLKEIPNNKFGTKGEIYWDDVYMNTQVGAIAHGSYTLRIFDPILFLKNYVPPLYYFDDKSLFDFADYDNAAAEQLFNEVVGSLAGSFSAYINESDKKNRIINIQRDSVGFAQSLSQTVESHYQWKKERGLQIVKAALISIEYDADTKKLMSIVKQADALIGARGNANLQASFAKGIQSAGENPNGGALGMGFMGMGLQNVAGIIGMMQQPNNTQQHELNVTSSSMTSTKSEDPYEKLAKLKVLLDQGVILQEEFDAAKSKLLDF